jgi:pyruvate formate lyase activating enzyme
LGHAIKGFLPSSMLDWPGKLAAVLFLAGCNFRCPFCHNPELATGSDVLPTLSWGSVRQRLRAKGEWLDGVCVTGGEPTIHDDLPVLLREIREMGLGVKLDTNGSRPRTLEALLREGLLDAVSMDLKTSPEKYGEATRSRVSFADIAESLEILKGSAVELEIRCTVVPGLVELEDLAGLAGLLGDVCAITLQQFRPEKTLDPSYGNLQPYDDEVLLEWKQALAEVVPVRLRGIRMNAPA